MAYINLLDYLGTIYNKEDCITELKKHVKALKCLPDNKVGFRVNQLVKNDNIRYFTSDYQEVKEDAPDRFWMWVDSGFKNKNDEVMYFQFRYSLTGWTGAYVGTETSILEHQMKEDNKEYEIKLLDVQNYQEALQEENDDFYAGMLTKELEALKSQLQASQTSETKEKSTGVLDTEVSEQNTHTNENNVNDTQEKIQSNMQTTNIQSANKVKSENKVESVRVEDTMEVDRFSRDSLKGVKLPSFYENLYSRLLIQSGWEPDKGNLQRYLGTIVARINHLIERNEDCSKYLVYNESKDYVLVNTALLDKFGKSIIIVCQVNDSLISYSNFIIVDGRQMLLRLGFSKDSIRGINIERVRFYDENKSELVFDGDIEDFDFDSWDRLVHCIDERRDRFPIEYKDMPSEALCSDMIKAIELGVALSKYDSSYIKPIYNRKFDKIHFVIPFHLGNNFQKKWELGIVVANFDNTFWQVMTILDYDSCQSDTRVLALYSDEYN